MPHFLEWNCYCFGGPESGSATLLFGTERNRKHKMSTGNPKKADQEYLRRGFSFFYIPNIQELNAIIICSTTFFVTDGDAYDD